MGTTVANAERGDVERIIAVLKEQLEQAFVGGQSTEDTIAKLTSGIATAVQ